MALSRRLPPAVYGTKQGTRASINDRSTWRAAELKDRVSRAGFVLALEIVDFLREWLQTHIKGTDKRYRECFNRHRLN